MKPTQEKILAVASETFGYNQMVQHLVQDINRQFKSVQVAVADGNISGAMLALGKMSRSLDDLTISIDGSLKEERQNFTPIQNKKTK